MSAVSSISSGISIHVLREEDDLRNALLLDGFVIISIHVLREEDDVTIMPPINRILISIHVLREEDDPIWSLPSLSTKYFNPRPPRGGRQIVGYVGFLPD